MLFTVFQKLLIINYFAVNIAAYLIKALEKVNCELNFEAINKGYVINIMQQIGISLYRLFTVYDRLHKTKVIHVILFTYFAYVNVKLI